MKVCIGADHRGVGLKEKIKDLLKQEGIDFEDFGTHAKKSVDYPDFGLSVAQAVAKGEYDRGILICNTGIGMSITANKVKGVYAALCLNKEMAEFSRKHNDANVLTLGAAFVEPDEAVEIVKTWLSTNFEGERHKKRVRKVKKIEDNLVEKEEAQKWEKEARKWQKEARHWQSRAWRR